MRVYLIHDKAPQQKMLCSHSTRLLIREHKTEQSNEKKFITVVLAITFSCAWHLISFSSCNYTCWLETSVGQALHA